MTRSKRSGKSASPEGPAARRQHSPPEALLPNAELREALGVAEHEMVNFRLNQIANLLFRHQEISEAELHQRIVRAIELYNSLAPGDGLEGMLAAQMVGTHEAALECLRRAASPGQTFAGRDMALKHAAKLMDLYTRQVAALDKHRGKGHQKVTVEHVHVEAGGQAIVGNVEAPSVPRPAQEETDDAPDAASGATDRASIPLHRGMPSEVEAAARPARRRTRR